MLTAGTKELIRQCSEHLGTCVERTVELNLVDVMYTLRNSISKHDEYWYQEVFNMTDYRKLDKVDETFITRLFDPAKRYNTKAVLAKQVVSDVSEWIMEMEQECEEIYAKGLKECADLAKIASAILMLDGIGTRVLSGTLPKKHAPAGSLYGYNTVVLHKPLTMTQSVYDKIKSLSLLAISKDGLHSVWKYEDEDEIAAHRKVRDEPQMNRYDFHKIPWYISKYVTAYGINQWQRISLSHVCFPLIRRFLHPRATPRVKAYLQCAKNVPVMGAILRSVFSDAGPLILRHYVARALYTS